MSSMLYNGDRPFVLASASPRRRDLLERQGLSFVVEPAEVDESFADGVSAEVIAVELAARKAEAVARRHQRGLVLGADTIVVLGGRILGKPLDAEDARRMFAGLCGRQHTVITGMALVDVDRGVTYRAHEATLVQLRAATDDEVRAYVATGEPLDKAGSYGAQALGAIFIERVEGCFYNVVGLPLARLHALIQLCEKRNGGAAAQKD